MHFLQALDPECLLTGSIQIIVMVSNVYLQKQAESYTMIVKYLILHVVNLKIQYTNGYIACKIQCLKLELKLE